MHFLGIQRPWFVETVQWIQHLRIRIWMPRAYRKPGRHGSLPMIPAWGDRDNGVSCLAKTRLTSEPWFQLWDPDSVQYCGEQVADTGSQVWVSAQCAYTCMHVHKPVPTHMQICVHTCTPHAYKKKKWEKMQTSVLLTLWRNQASQWSFAAELDFNDN